MLDKERARISSVFKNTGFYKFNKEYIGFIADTLQGNNNVDLELTIYPFMEAGINKNIITKPHEQYTIQNVLIYVDFDPLEDGNLQEYVPTEIEKGDGYAVIYGKRGKYIRPSIVLSNCYILPDALYNENLANLTYNAMSQLRILRNINISFREKDSLNLDCIITCVPDKRQGFSAEIEGTNSSGYLGMGAGVGYLHRNIFKGSELFNVKLSGSYEAVTPSFSSFEDNYFELRSEASLTFPRFINPFLTNSLKRRLHASTQLTLNYNYQRRPGFFTRTVLAGGVKYIWNERKDKTIRHTFDLLDLSYVNLPEVNQEFLATLTTEARIYSFQNQFIASAGYTFYKSNYDPLNKNTSDIKTIRASIETAGNLLSLISEIANIEPDSEGAIKIFNTRFSQYVRGNFDYSRTFRIDEKNSIAWRIGAGVAYPYGKKEYSNNDNTLEPIQKLIPIQKRFFAGGGNSVRGWGIRELGPGSYYSPNSNFYFHSGDIRFDANIEYRSKAFWIIEFAAFLDAGNIWTLKEYNGQENGSFHFDNFYKQIASAWGLGLRFDFDFVLVRLDCGWKLYDPANRYSVDESGNKIYESNKSHWPILDPLNIRKNTAWHIAIGYPF